MHFQLKYTICSPLLDKIGELYAKEAEFKREANGDREKLLKLRKKKRPKESAKIIDEIYLQKDWLKRKSAHVLSDDIRKGINYLEDHEKKLRLFLTYPEVELDNNPVEQDIRSAVQGRKNHYQSRSERGVESSAILYSLIGFCQNLGLPVREYFRAVSLALLKVTTRLRTS